MQMLTGKYGGLLKAHSENIGNFVGMVFFLYKKYNFQYLLLAPLGSNKYCIYLFNQFSSIA